MLDVDVNGKQYALVEDRSGAKVTTRPVQQFTQSFRTTGRTRPEDIAPYESFIVPNLAYGFGRYRINSDAAFDPKEYRRFWNSTCDTRWMDAVYLPILSEDSTETGLEVIRASVDFVGKLNGMWEDGTSTTLLNRQYTGGSTTWENGGTIMTNTLALVSEGEAVSASATGLTLSHTIADNNLRVLVVFQSHTNPGASTTVTYDGIPLTLADSQDGRGDITVWYLINPPVGTANIVSTNSNSAAVHIQAFDFKGADITSPLRTAAKELLTTAGSHTADLAPTTVAGDIVVDYITCDDSHTLTVGAGQNQVANSHLSSAMDIASSYETASGVSTTMSWAVSGTGHNLMAVPVATTASTEVVGLDMITHKAKLIALGVQGKSHVVSTSTDGATWKGIPSGQTQVTDLNGAISSVTATSVPVTSAADLKVHDTILVATEQMHITAIATNTLTVERGYNGTTAATQLDEALVTVLHDIQHSLLSNVVTANEDIDAGLLAEIGGELVAAVWDEVGKVIRFYSSTDSGDKWQDENIRLGSNNGPQGLVVYPDIDRENKLYLATNEGIHIIDTGSTDWTSEIVFRMPSHEDNGRRMTIHNGAIWVAQGVDNSTPAPVNRITVQGDSRTIEAGYGLSFGDGVISDLLGPIRWMVSAGDFLFASVGGGAANRNARLICWNSNGWHHMTKYGTANKKIQWIHFSSRDDGIPRLHYAVRTGDAVSNTAFLAQPLVNPRSGVAIKRADLDGTNAGHIELPYYDFGLPQENKNLVAVHIVAEDLTDASNEFIEVEYGINGAATTTDLANFTSSTVKSTFASDAGLSAKNIGFRLKFNRADGTNTNTPKLRDFVVEGFVVPTIQYEHQMTIDIKETAQITGQSVETVISNLETIVSSVTQVVLKFGSVSKYVAVDRERSAFSFALDSWENSGPTTLADRTGVFNLVLIEKVAS